MGGNAVNTNESAIDVFHPIVGFLIIISVMLFTVFTLDPIVIGLSLASGIVYCIFLCGKSEFWRDLRFLTVIFLVLSLTNPLFSHKGESVLFFLNGAPITLEALLYGVDLSIMTCSIIIWGKCFSKIMTSDKVILLVGALFPRISLTISIVLRNIPLFKKRWREIKEAQSTMGYYSDESIMTRIQGSAKAFSALLTWAIEGSVDSGASMLARGYGLGRRTRFTDRKFNAADLGMTFFVCLVDALMIILSYGCPKVSFYPRISGISLAPYNICLYFSFAVISLMPAIIELTEKLRWKYYRSKI